MSTDSRTSPYQGLSPFSLNDRRYFTGRQTESKIIVANLMTSPLTLLYGESGVGKTSLLDAGVVPRIIDKYDFAHVVFYRDWKSPDYCEKLKRKLMKFTNLRSDWQDPEFYQLSLAELVKKITSDGSVVIVLLDQFEEYFLYNAGTSKSDIFEAELAHAVNDDTLAVNFLFSLREDHLSLLDKFKPRIPGLFGNYIRVNHLSADAAEEAITKPLRIFNEEFNGDVQLGEGFAKGVISEIVAKCKVDMEKHGGFGRVERGGRESSIEAPILQLILTRVWNWETKHGSKVLNLETLTDEDKLGGIDKIFGDHVHDALRDFDVDDGQKEIISTVLKHLVTPSGTKIAHHLSDLSKFANTEPGLLRPILDKLSEGDTRILGLVSGDRNDPYYEIYHDVLAGPILDWREEYEAKKRDAEAKREAEERAERAERESILMTREARKRTRLAMLAIGLALVAAFTTYVATRGWYAAEDLAERATYERQRAEREARSALISEENAEFEAASARKAEEVAKRQSSLRLIALREARESKTAAEEAQKIAEERKTSLENKNRELERVNLMLSELNKSVEASRDVEKQTRIEMQIQRNKFENLSMQLDALRRADLDSITRAESLAMASIHQLRSDQEIALQLATLSVLAGYAGEQGFPYYGTSALRNVLEQYRLKRVLLPSFEDERYAGHVLIDYHNETNAASVSYSNGNIVIFDVGRGASANTIDTAEDTAALPLFLGEQRLVMSLDSGSDLTVWDGDRAVNTFSLDTRRQTITGIDISRDATMLAVCGDNGTLQILGIEETLSENEPITRIKKRITRDKGIVPNPIQRIAPRILPLIGTADGSNYSSFSDVAFSADQYFVATSSLDSVVALWDVAGLKRISEWKGANDEAFLQVAVSSDNSLVATVTNVGSVYLFGSAEDSKWKALRLQDDYPITQIAFGASPDRMYTSSENGVITLWRITSEGAGNIPTLRKESVIFADSGSITDVVVSQDGRILLAGYGSGETRVWDLTPQEELEKAVSGLEPRELLMLALGRISRNIDDEKYGDIVGRPDAQWRLMLDAVIEGRSYARESDWGTEKYLQWKGHVSDKLEPIWITLLAEFFSSEGKSRTETSSEEAGRPWFSIARELRNIAAK